jgi:type I restriction enzyme S subunit
MSKEKLIPSIRFPDFNNEEEWDIEELGVLSEIVRGGSPRPIEDYFTSDVNGLNWLKIADVPSDSKYITQTKVKVKKEALSSTREVSSGDLILSNSMSFGRPYILKITTCIHDGWIAIRKISNKTFEDYLYYFISSESSQSYFQTNAAGAAVKNLNAEIIKLLPIYLPKNKKEQQKIASCLSFLDEIIATHSQKLNLLKDHKKGMMQNLFPQEGEKVPKYRFKEFENDGEWVEKKLNYYLELLTDFEANGSFADVKANVNVFDEPNYAWYVRATDLEKKSNSDSIKYVDEHSYNFLNKTKLLGGELLITKRGEIGKVYMYKPFKELPATVAPNLYLLKLNEKAEPKFFYFHFTNTIGNQSLKRLNASSTIGALYKDDVKNISVFVPSLKEQQKIASCLYSLDALITAQTERIEQLKLHKKGLMQGLFPKIEI